MAAKKILVPYNFSKNEIQNAVAQVLASAPGSPVAGQFYYDSTTLRWTYHNGTAFVADTDRARHTGTQAWGTITGTPTTLSGYGIADALSNSASSTQNIYGGDLFLFDDTTPSHYLQFTVADNLTAARSLSISVSDANRTLTLSGNLTVSAAATISGTNTGDQTITLTGDVAGTGTGSFGATLATVNGAPQTDTFRKITVNGKGLVTATSAVLAADIPTLTSAKISDFDTQVRTSRLDQMAAPTASVSMNTQKITNLLDPTADQDAATKKYVDDNIAGLSWKDEVRVATTAAGTLASSFANGSTVDSVVLATNDRILIKDQASATENGIYFVNAAGAPTRVLDANTGPEILGAAVFVSNGTTNTGTRWVSNTAGPITIGSTSITFAQFGGGTSYTAGNGLTLTANDFNVGAGTGITVDASNVNIDTAVVARKYTQTIGDNSATSIGVTHSLSNQWVHAQVIEVATLSQVECDIVWTSSSVTTFIFAVAPTTNQFRVVIFG